MNRPRCNVEIKARCADLAALRLLALEAGAEFVVEMVQHDTYFRHPRKRLKLRLIEDRSGRRAELIGYRRNDAERPRPSRYTVRRVRLPALRRRWLALRYGVLAEVSKRRELWRRRGVRIHLDEVEGLGSFVELEAVVGKIGSVEEAERRCRRLMEILGVDSGEIIGCSYADLVVERAVEQP